MKCLLFVPPPVTLEGSVLSSHSVTLTINVGHLP